ncbi:MAG: DNA internalization-related competence protein ComEC/Rec2, partial [Thiohalospira sp.]
MIAGTLAFIAGVGAVHLLPALPSWWGPWLLSGLLVPLLPRAVALPLLAGLFGFGWSLWQAATPAPLPAELAGEEVRLVGEVVGLAEPDGRRTRFLFRVQRALVDGRPVAVAGRVRLDWYGETPALHPGQRLGLTARLKQPRRFANPGGFDYAGWLYREGITATGWVRSAPVAHHPSGAAPVDRLRATLGERLASTLPPGAEAPGLLRALALGDRRDITDEQWSTLLATGTNHLVAISGLHVGLVAGLAWGVTRRLWPRVPGLAAVLSAPRAAVLMGGLAATAYAALAGFAIPTQRALAMLLVAGLLLWWYRPARPAHGLAAAAWLVLLLDPRAVLAPGFWLSFAAVAVILYALDGRLRRSGPVGDALRIQVVVSLGLVPLLVGLFGEASLAAPLANLVMVPLVGLAVVPLVLAGMVLLLPWPAAATLLFTIADGLLATAWPLLEGLASVPALQFTGTALPAAVLVMAAAGMAWLAGPRGLPGRPAAVALMLPLVFWDPGRPPAGEVRITVLDVGQGLAAVVRTRDHTLVYDAGPHYGGDFEAGSAIIAPYLAAQGVHRVDTLVVSHGDRDHAGGAPGLRSAEEVERVVAGEPGALEGGAEPCPEHRRWSWDGVELALAAGRGEGNAASCALRVEAGGHSALFTGDRGRAGERALLEREEWFPVDWLLIPHHGSTTSSSPALLEAARPRRAALSVGHDNPHGHPDAAVMDRYRGRG